MYLAALILLGLTLAAAVAAVVVGLLVRERLGELLKEVRTAREQVHEVGENIGTTIVEVADGRPPLGGPVTGERPGFGAPPYGRPTVQPRTVDPEAPTQTYGAVRPGDRP